MITCSIHSTEVASTQTAIEFVYKLITEDTPRHRAILDNTIFLLIPSLNPDGVDKVANWYQRYLGTPYEGAPMIELYQKYAGHDNNRDWYMFTQAETRLAVEKVHNVWHPQIVYDVHQMGSNGARMFVPPWTDPIDPNIDPLLMQQVNMMGSAMAVDLVGRGQEGRRRQRHLRPLHARAALSELSRRHAAAQRVGQRALRYADHHAVFFARHRRPRL